MFFKGVGAGECGAVPHRQGHFLMSGKGLNSLKARLICSMKLKW